MSDAAYKSKYRTDSTTRAGILLGGGACQGQCSVEWGGSLTGRGGDNGPWRCRAKWRHLLRAAFALSREPTPSPRTDSRQTPRNVDDDIVITILSRNGTEGAVVELPPMWAYLDSAPINAPESVSELQQSLLG